ncbi:hypothetical protein M407DRAFT_24380 [Tulasnella calospora MUT 4182]|uniref:HSF-type DNA-binding domain-containing protein n=1 Tax=Tulasnella calospora MUT 4182 TaxID=1051891 RepID=A0A0C3Q8T6_9AGAM|nr:hypothetical protein M407DRAFT_24380 [Tulasnella calospora MUT 4182]
MDEDNDEYDVNLGAPPLPQQFEGPERNNCGDAKRVPSGGYFPRKLSLMLSDETMAKYIKLDERQGSKAFKIPNIEAFVANALPKYFPDMNQWGSFQKQLSNYGYKKKDRDKESGIWILRNKNPSDVLHQCKDPPPRKTPQERRPTTTTPAASGKILQPQDQPDLYTRVDKIEKELNATKSELMKTRALLSETRTQLQAMMDLVGRLTGLSVGDSSSHSITHPGPAVETPGNDFRKHEEASYGGTHYEPIPQRQTDVYSSPNPQNSFSHRGTETTYNTVNPDLLVHQSPHPQPSSYASSPHPAHPTNTIPRAEAQQTSGGDFPQHLLYSWIENVPDHTDSNHFGLQQNVSPPIVSQNFASTSAAAFAGQPPTLPQNSNPNSPRTSSRRALYGGSQPVPLPQPGSGPSWLPW